MAIMLAMEPATHDAINVITVRGPQYAKREMSFPTLQRFYQGQNSSYGHTGDQETALMRSAAKLKYGGRWNQRMFPLLI
jgi:hypothetical protein